MDKIRLHQFLSRTGEFKSKKEIVDAIRNGEIRVGVNVIDFVHFQFKPNNEKVYWKDRLLKPVSKKLYLLMNKPEGYLSSRLTSNDITYRERSVFQILEQEESLDFGLKQSLFCVGRLDKNTSGLLIITNDGALGNRITEPVNDVKKVYEVLLDSPLTKEEIFRIQAGVVIDLEDNGEIFPYKTRPCKVQIVEPKRVRITLTEGKKREVRRIFEKVRHDVKKLKRIAIGKLELGDLKIGQYKFVTKEYLLQHIK
jgi:23S rRNA pseudouridine2605 synthase